MDDVGLQYKHILILLNCVTQFLLRVNSSHNQIPRVNPFLPTE